jgi:hypothetical protein
LMKDGILIIIHIYAKVSQYMFVNLSIYPAHNFKTTLNKQTKKIPLKGAFARLWKLNWTLFFTFYPYTFIWQKCQT